MSPKKSCTKRFHYRRVWLASLIVTTTMLVMTLGFNSLAVHLPSSRVPSEAGNARAARSGSNAISSMNGTRTAESALKLSGSTAGTPIVIDSATNMRLEALPDPGYLAPLAPAPAKQAANLDQIRNGSASSPTNPADWVNGNAGASTAHYREGYSIAYRLVLTNLTSGPHNVKIEWDIRNGGKSAIDYITNYDRINSPNHVAIFGHAAEVIDPTGAAPGSDPSDFISGLGAPGVASIPAPSAAGSTVAGQPATSFGALPAAEKNMTTYNATGVVLSYVSQGSLTASNSSTQLNINFNGSGTVVLAWGGHIASSSDWGAGNSAGGISGSSYHTRLISLDGSGGNQDRSLSASAVQVDCATCSVGTATTAECGTQKTHTATINAGGVCDTPQHSWSFVTNTSGATFAGSTTGSSVTVNVGTACSGLGGGYTVKDTITCSGCTTGSTISCSQTVTVSDTTAPLIGSPGSNGTISCPAVPVFTAPTATDNCDLTPTIQQVSDVTTPGSCAGTYSRTVTWRAVDDCGNASNNVSQTITVVDTTAPSIGSPGANATIECPASPSFTPPTATDACDSTPTIVEVSDVTTPGSCTGSYSRTKTWKAVDDCGNQSGTVSQTITVEDHTAPSIGSPGANATIECPATPNFTAPTATDACDTSPQIIEVSDETTPGSCSGSYSRTKTWKARDCAGNESSTVSQTITVHDTTAPTIGSPGSNATIECPATPNFTAPTATDACDTSPQIIEVSDVTTPGSCSGSYSRTKTWKAKDCAGNESGTVSQTITVSDTTAPSIGSPGGNATIECPATPNFTAPTATDACDTSPQIIEVSDVTTPGDCPGEYSRTKTWKARDCTGNESGTVSQTITVQDTTAPTITTCPADVTVTCFADVAGLGDFYAQGGSASDSCGDVIVTSEDSEPFDTSSCGTSCGGKITRTYTVRDCAGHTVTCPQIITYGTPGSLQSAQQDLIASLLKSGDLVVGEPGRSLTIPGGLNAKSSAFCIVTKLSSSGAATALPEFGDKKLDPATCQTSPSLDLQKDGTWSNVALSQAIQLALNLRLSSQQEQLKQQAKASGLAAVLEVGRPDADFDLGSFALTSTLSTQGALPGPDGLRGTFDDELDLSSARLQLTIPASVITALGPNATAADLLRLANAELAGVSKSDVKLSDIAAALDAVNRSFDFGKRRLVLNK